MNLLSWLLGSDDERRRQRQRLALASHYPGMGDPMAETPFAFGLPEDRAGYDDHGRGGGDEAGLTYAAWQNFLATVVAQGNVRAGFVPRGIEDNANESGGSYYGGETYPQDTGGGGYDDGGGGDGYYVGTTPHYALGAASVDGGYVQPAGSSSGGGGSGSASAPAAPGGGGSGSLLGGFRL